MDIGLHGIDNLSKYYRFLVNPNHSRHSRESGNPF